MKRVMTPREVEIADFEIDLSTVFNQVPWKKRFLHDIAERLYNMGYCKHSQQKNDDKEKIIKTMQNDIAELKLKFKKIEIGDQVEFRYDYGENFDKVAIIAEFVYNKIIYSVEVFSCPTFIAIGVGRSATTVLNKKDFAIIRVDHHFYDVEKNDIQKNYIYLSKKNQTARKIEDDELEFLCQKYESDITKELKERENKDE